jgi:two-component system phosphate regulon sensor histidine kinase PhoR
MVKTSVQTRRLQRRRAALKQELTWLALLTLGAISAVALGADSVLAFAVGLFVYAIWHLIQAARLLSFLVAGREPQARWMWGLWREAFDQVVKLKKREHKRKRRQQTVFSRIRKMAAAMPDAVLTLSSDGEISWLNRQAEVYFGLVGEPVLGQKLVDLIEHPTLKDYIKAEQFRRGLEVEAPGDPAMMLEISVTRFKKRRERFLLVARDITRQYLLNRTQRDFSLNVSHELRTPLTVLRGYLETMAEGEEQTSPKRLPLLRMQEQVSRMQGVIKDLFTLSRLEHGVEAIKRDPVAVFDMLEDVVMEAGELARDTHHTLKLSGERNLLVAGDESLLRCAFSNLVSNAIRHTPGRTQVEISWLLADDRAEFVVRDNGEGIPARHLPRLTERFYRVDPGRSREAGGTGLGLAIVRQILDMHEARLLVSSEEGRGSTFTCQFSSPRIVNEVSRRALTEQAS